MNPREFPINQSFIQGIKDMRLMERANEFEQKPNGIKIVKYSDSEKKIIKKRG